MIEPQNTVFPVAAEPRPTQQPEDETPGFGAMLAQSLGLVAPSDPDLVQQIGSGHEHQASSEEAFDDADTQSLGTEDPITIGIAPSPAGGGAIGVIPPSSTSPGPFLGAEPLPVAGGITDPVPTLGVAAPTIPEATTMPDGGPAPSVPGTPTTIGSPEPADPVEGIRPPVLTDAPEGVDPTIGGSRPLAPADPGPGDTIGLPIPTEIDGDVGIGTKVTPVAVQPTVADPAPETGVVPTTTPLQPAPAIPVAPSVPPRPVQQDQTPPLGIAPPSRDPLPVEGTAEPVVDRGIPVPPVRTGMPGTPKAPVQGIVETPSVGVAPPVTTEPRINLIPEPPIRVDTPERSVGVNETVVSNQAGRSIGVDGGVAETPVSFTAPVSASSPVVASSSPAEVLPAQTSALAERVMRAVDLQRTQPPPRSVVVDIPEIEGLRLVVSLRSGGHVSVTPASSTASADVFPPFAEDLSRVLSERGFVMNGDDRRGGRHRHDEEQPAPFKPGRPTFRRPVRSDNDLRI